MHCTLDITEKHLLNLDGYRAGSGLSRSQALESLLELCFPESTDELPTLGDVALVDDEAAVLAEPNATLTLGTVDGKPYFGITEWDSPTEAALQGQIAPVGDGSESPGP